MWYYCVAVCYGGTENQHPIHPKSVVDCESNGQIVQYHSCYT